ncbi:MAG: hypothetical protein P8P74_03685, partial [Crocinitomicaceae bacterium]|nr:hypothetical protein [Crocinitomicaceae bacterium]
MAQSESNPEDTDANYASQKHSRLTQIRSTNGTSQTEAVENISVDRPGSAASLNKATSACFIPLDASYTALPRNDDGSFGPIALPFTFDLYGASYTQVWINTNGNITFNGPYSAYSASGFPFSLPMVAPFWGDVDTRNTAGGQIHYKLSATNLVVTWDHVGYYSNAVDKLNEFQVVISDGVDPITGLGQNVCFNYGDMQWTTGSASGGVNGFGGTPATVGVNKGNNIDFYQLGRFNVNSAIYDGPGGNSDGINYLDQQCYCSQVSSAVNIAPIANNFPSGVINIDCGETYNLDFSFIPPEVNQTLSTTMNNGGTCGTTFSATSGSISNVSFSLLGQQCNEGTNVITFTATDNGTPVESTSVTLTINVGTCCDLTASSTGQDESCANQSDGSITVSTTGGMAPLSYSIDGGATYSGSPNFNGLATGTYVVVAQDMNGCESVPQTITIGGPTQLTSSSSSTAILCNGGTSTVTVTGSGGTSPYSGTGTYTVNSGPYSYTVTDANGCTSITSGTVGEPTQLVPSASSTAIDCNGGTSTISVSATGGTAPYSGTGNFTVGVGTYSYTVTDANNCSEVVSITVAEPTTLVASATATEILCNGGTTNVTVTATGGTAPYSGNIVYTESAGTYTYTVTDANGCTSDATITVTEPTQLA